MNKNSNYEDGIALSVYLVMAAAKIQRNIAKLLIRRGLVTVNDKTITNTLHPVYPGDEVKVKDRPLKMPTFKDFMF